jgi:hypothetical protein
MWSRASSCGRRSSSTPPREHYNTECRSTFGRHKIGGLSRARATMMTAMEMVVAVVMTTTTRARMTSLGTEAAAVVGLCRAAIVSQIRRDMMIGAPMARGADSVIGWWGHKSVLPGRAPVQSWRRPSRQDVRPKLRHTEGSGGRDGPTVSLAVVKQKLAWRRKTPMARPATSGQVSGSSDLV